MDLSRKTKIVCTIGPASDNEKILRELMLEGMNVCRLNFSHGTHAEHLLRVNLIKQLREELNLPIAILLDTKGPEIRTGEFPEPVLLSEGSEVAIRHADVMGSDKEFSVSYKGLAADIAIGSRILIDDGLIELVVERIEGKDVLCRVMNGGLISSRKSINLPETAIQLPALTEKDVSDIQFAVEHEFDFIAASFIRKAADVTEIRRIMDKMGRHNIRIISKIENREGVNNFDSILEESDGIMVARGDLGVEISAHEVPTVQKHLIQSCYRSGKPCITATQMLDSMMRNPRPTRAETSDVANAILDGTSAVMLSGETAAGRYPLDALRMMVKIALYTEQHYDYWDMFRKTGFKMAPSVANAVSRACCTTAMDLNAKAIIAVSHSGRTARLLSRFRPACVIIATTVSEQARRKLALSWGVVPYRVDEMKNTDELFEVAKNVALESGLVCNGDIVVISGGTPVGMSGTTNTLKVQNIGRVLVQGIAIGKGSVSGETLLVTEKTDPTNIPTRHDYILVAEDTDKNLIHLMRKARAIIVEAPEEDCHAVTVAETLDIPVVYACSNATRILHSGSVITIDTETGIVS